MTKAKQLTAKQISNENPVKATTDQSLSQIKNTMEENRMLTIPVTNDGDFKGAISYRELIRYIQFNPSTTKVSKVLHNPPQFEYTDNLVDLSNLRINSGKKMFVALEDSELKGVISEQEILQHLNDVEEIKNISTRDISTYELESTFEEDLLEKARHTMLDKNISRLPVLNNDGKLTGVIHSIDLLQTLIPRERVSSGGTSESRQADEQGLGGGNEKEKFSDVPVKEIMDRTPTFIEGHVKLTEAINQMKEEESDEVIITQDGYPEAILTIKDIIRHLTQFSEPKTLHVQITGLHLPEEKAAVNQKIRNQVKGSLGRKLKNPRELKFHVKKSDADGTKHRYQIIAKLHSDYGVITANEEEWDLLDAVDRALENLNKQVRKVKEKKEDR